MPITPPNETQTPPNAWKGAIRQKWKNNKPLHHVGLRGRVRLMALVLQSCANQSLKILKLAHQRSRLNCLHLALASQLLVLISKSCHLLTEIRAIISYHTSLSLHARSLASVFLGLFFVLHLSSISVHTSKMLVQIFLSREALAGESLAIWMRTVELLSGTAMKIVYLSLMPQKSSRVREARQFLTSLCWAFVGTIMLVHVLVEVLARMDLGLSQLSRKRQAYL